VYGTIRVADLFPLIIKSALLTGAVMFMVATATIFSWILVVQQVPQRLGDIVFSISSEPMLFLAMIILVFMILGGLLEGIPAMIILVPIFARLAQQVGVHPLHFALVAYTAVSIGLFLPPFGIGLLLSSALGEISIEKATPAFLPYLIVLGIGLLWAAFPWLTLALLRSSGWRASGDRPWRHCSAEGETWARGNHWTKGITDEGAAVCAPPALGLGAAPDQVPRLRWRRAAPATANVRAMELFRMSCKLSGTAQGRGPPAGSSAASETMEATQRTQQMRWPHRPSFPFARKMDVMSLLFWPAPRRRSFGGGRRLRKRLARRWRRSDSGSWPGGRRPATSEQPPSDQYAR
jgi:hypothetical protein